jgi:alpha-beta hydrolase superfamily lysophospholipase
MIRFCALIPAVSLLVGCAPPSLPARPPRTPTPAVTGVEHETDFFTDAGDVTIFEQSWRPDGAVRGAVVIQHGLKSYSQHYAPLANRLAKQGFAVYALDMRGHGRSAGPRATLDDFEALVADLAHVVEEARDREGDVPVFVVGHSFGGAVVTLYALERRPAIAGLILLAPALRVDRLPIEAAATPIAALLTPNAPAVDVPDAYFSRSPAVVEEMGNDPLIYDPPGPASTAGALLRALETIWAHADELEVPLLALHGTADRATDPRGSVEMVRRARTDDKTLLLYRGLRHDLVREPEREQVMQDIERWLGRHAPAPAGR